MLDDANTLLIPARFGWRRLNRVRRYRAQVLALRPNIVERLNLVQQFEGLTHCLDVE